MPADAVTTESRVESLPVPKAPRGYLWRLRTWVHLPAIGLALWLDNPSSESAVAAVPLLALGLLVRTWALGFICKDRVLCTAGPYSLMRHPLYLGNLIILAGALALANSALLAAVLAPIGFGYYLCVIRSEEGWLAGRFGDEWTAYAARVPSLLPRPTIPIGHGFSWSRARANGAVLNGVLLVAVVLLLASKAWVAPLVT